MRRAYSLQNNANECNKACLHHTLNVLYCYKKRCMMNIVQPIRNLEKVEELKQELKKNGTRDFLMFHTRFKFSE